MALRPRSCANLRAAVPPGHAPLSGCGRRPRAGEPGFAAGTGPGTLLQDVVPVMPSAPEVTARAGLGRAAAGPPGQPPPIPPSRVFLGRKSRSRLRAAKVWAAPGALPPAPPELKATAPPVLAREAGRDQAASDRNPRDRCGSSVLREGGRQTWKTGSWGQLEEP